MAQSFPLHPLLHLFNGAPPPNLSEEYKKDVMFFQLHIILLCHCQPNF